MMMMMIMLLEVWSEISPAEEEKSVFVLAQKAEEENHQSEFITTAKS